MNDDLISREALKREFETLFYNDCGDFVRTERLIDDAPTIEERPKGKWIESDVPESMLWKCSVCGYQLGAHSFKYCPMCGADMSGDT